MAARTSLVGPSTVKQATTFRDPTGKCWTDTTSEAATGVQPPTGKGGCLIILHTGTRNGFIYNGELIFQAKNDGDYHKQMNSTVFEEWFRNQLLPNIAPNSIIVMDNAPYHSVLQEKVPSSSRRKVELKEWLERKGVQLSDELLKAELYELTKKFAVGKKYRIDSIADLAGHRVVKSPPYHCQYNPTELIWAQVKSYIAMQNTFKMAGLKHLVKEAQHHITPHNCMQTVAHAENL
ncbi:uncharacterized protein LOC135092001 [Scylla paramamosain]|uniref:uncharacterized protein LOC135092001 n=1 Tax=Scylla paramamosain TaxID=85552 RepID=UPI0030826ED8